jgi:hypothetical protein
LIKPEKHISKDTVHIRKNKRLKITREKYENLLGTHSPKDNHNSVDTSKKGDGNEIGNYYFKADYSDHDIVVKVNNKVIFKCAIHIEP